MYISFHNLVNTVIINTYKHHPLIKTDSQLLNNLVSSSTHAQSHSFKSPLGYFHTSPSQFKIMYTNVLTNGFCPHINVENDDVFKTVQNGNQIH